MTAASDAAAQTVIAVRIEFLRISAPCGTLCHVVVSVSALPRRYGFEV